MGNFALKSLISAVTVAWAAVTVMFLVMHVLPGDAATAILGENASQQAIDNLRQELGLNQPLYLQYWDYVSKLVTGNLGKSVITSDALTPIILRGLAYTFVLALGGTLIGILIGVPAGVLAATRRGSVFDHGSRILVLFGISLPPFVIAILLILLFVLNLHWFPMMGGGDLDNPPSLLRYAFLPALTFGLIQAAYITRLTRSAMLDTLRKDYIRTAHAKGVSETRVMYRHALRNSLIPVTTVVGLTMGRALAGSAVIETVFSRPGLGFLFVNAALSRDYTLMQSTLVVFAVLIVLVNKITDLFYGLLDPRIRIG